MYFFKSFVNDELSSVLPPNTKIKERVEKSDYEVDLVVQHNDNIKIIKILAIIGLEEKKMLEFLEKNSLLSNYCLSFIYLFETVHISECNECMVLEREYYSRDLEEKINNKSMSKDDICNVIYSISSNLMILSEIGLVVGNIKSSNIIYEKDGDIKICDLFLNELRKEEDMRIYNICYKSPEELNSLECNERSVIWSIGCILYEMINKKLPFNEDNDMFKTMNYILRCIYSFDVECDNLVKEIIEKMLKVKSEDRLSLKEVRKEMMKMSEILRDGDNYLIINNRKETLFNNDYFVEISSFNIKADYFVQYNKWEVIRDVLIELYNNKPNERILSILLMMKIYKGDYSIKDKLKFQINHKCRIEDNYLDRMIFGIQGDVYNKYLIHISTFNICHYCEEGMNYFFRMMKLINPTEIQIGDKFCIFLHQSLFGSLFSQLSDLEGLDITECNLTSYFIESFVKSIPFMKLKYVKLDMKKQSSKSFKFLLPYLHLLINKDNELNLQGMYLNNESMILLSEELYKYPNIEKITIKENKNIHFKELKALFSKIPISSIEFDFNGSKELLIDKDIPELIKYIKNDYNVLNLNNSKIDDDIFKSFIVLRLNELGEVEEFDLRNNILTYKSVEILINNLSSLSNLKTIHLCGNEIGDEGMKILTPHLDLLQCGFSKMGLSSNGLKYLVDGLKNIHQKIEYLDISDNNIDEDGIECLMNYMKDNDNIEMLFIHNNPIGDNGFKLLYDNLNLITNFDDLNLSNTSIGDESIILLAKELDAVRRCFEINLNDNNIKMEGLQSICSKSLKYDYWDGYYGENETYPIIEMNNPSWTNEELKYYLDYYIEKRGRMYYTKVFDFSNMNINDSYISFIKRIDYEKLDLSNNHISIKGFKELTELEPIRVTHISIFNNEIGDEGIEIICENLEIFVKTDYIDEKSNLILNMSNIGMGEKGLRMLIEGLKGYGEMVNEIYLSGNELSEEELRLMKENQEVFDCLIELSITVKDDIDKSELKSFLETFSTIGWIKIDGISEEEKKELSKEFYNIK